MLTSLSLVVPHSNQSFAESPNATQGQEKVVPQGNDPPGSDNEDQSKPMIKHNGAIKTASDWRPGHLHAGTKEEVIPPPGSPGSEHPNVQSRYGKNLTSKAKMMTMMMRPTIPEGPYLTTLTQSGDESKQDKNEDNEKDCA